jgi:hypothetical protein
MLIAKIKEEENIAEYILYMWQMEDLIRGNNFDLDQIMGKLLPGDELGEEKEEYRIWFAGLIQEMIDGGLVKTGHLKGVKTYMSSLESLHHTLVTVYQDNKYLEIYKKAASHIQALRDKNAASDKIPETEVCLIGLYGMLILKMSGQEISPETLAAMGDISKMMGYLANAFNKLKKGELSFPSQMNN